MAQLAKELAAKWDNLSSIPEIHTVDENWLLQVSSDTISTPKYMWTHMYNV